MGAARLVPVRERRDTGRAMSQENVEIVRRAFDAFARGDLEAVVATLDPAVKLEDHDRSLDSPATYQGREGFLQGIALVNEGFEDVRYTPEEFTDTGRRVLVTVRRTGRGTASGVAVDELQFHVFDVENGRIVRVRAFLERKEALEAAGLPE
jgi:ketosteroid isomerase-like protein